jgi:hypothetical protein
MSPRPVRRHPDDVFQSFIRELAQTQQQSAMLERLRKGHEPDRHGWCRHPAHSHRWERHPCATLRLADLAEETKQQE